jgi:16S rRNA (uracil1498-N3)-methyltransferase
MSLPRFFVSSILEPSSASFDVPLSAADLHHANVIRLAKGEHIVLVDSSNTAREYKICELDASHMCAEFVREVEGECLPHVTLFQGVSKGERMDFVMRHVTEVGISAIVPLFSSRCIVKLDEKKRASRMERWEKIVRSAAEQSGRSIIPELKSPVNSREACELFAEYDRVLLAYEEVRNARLRDSLEGISSTNKVAIIIGPEGGFSPEEDEMFVSCGAVHFGLGDTILRTETAGLVASSLVLYELGALGNRVK